MLPPESSAHTPPSPPDLAGEQRRDRRRARTLDDELRPLEQHRDRIGDLVVDNVDALVEQVVEDRAS